MCVRIWDVLSWIRGLVTCSVPIRCLWTQSQTAFPWDPIRCLWTQSQNASPWVPIPSQWISGCLSSSSYLPANESHTAFPWVPISHPNFWSLLVGYHPCPAPPTSGMPLESPQLHPERDFGCTPYNHTWVPQKSILERFRALLRDFCFWANFWFSESKKSWSSTPERVSKKTRRLDSTIQSPQMVIQRWALEWQK